jgi:hypothetical protein
MVDELSELMKKLPKDIIDYIIPYTYNPQNKHLLHDIIDYMKTKQKILELYHTFWIIYVDAGELEDKYWLLNDIIIYANGNKPTNRGYMEHFYHIFGRNSQLHTKEQIDMFVCNLENKCVETQINIAWGLLLPNEREYVIDDFISRNGNK